MRVYTYNRYNRLVRPRAMYTYAYVKGGVIAVVRLTAEPPAILLRSTTVRPPVARVRVGAAKLGRTARSRGGVGL